MRALIAIHSAIHRGWIHHGSEQQRKNFRHLFINASEVPTVELHAPSALDVIPSEKLCPFLVHRNSRTILISATTVMVPVSVK